jgi:hypothetical protein
MQIDNLKSFELPRLLSCERVIKSRGQRAWSMGQGAWRKSKGQKVKGNNQIKN